MTRSQPFTNVGPRLREAREAAGVSLEVLAERTRYGKTTLSYYETGKRALTADVIAAYHTHLGARIGLDPTQTIEYVGRADVERRTFIRTAAYTTGLSALALAGGDDLARLTSHGTGTRVGAETVAAMRRITDSYIWADETLGGGLGRTTVAEHLATVIAPLLRGRFTTEQVRADAFAAATEVAYLAGWKSHDAGLDGLAQRYYHAALDLAAESGDLGHQAFVLRILALQGCDVNQRAYATGLAAEALRRARAARLDPDTETLFHIALARTRAETGDQHGAARALARAPHLHPDQDGPFPRWAAQWCPNKATHLTQAAKTFAAMGDRSETVALLEAVATMWDPVEKPRIWALSMADLGHAHWALADTSAATAAWEQALPILDQLDSERTTTAAERIRGTVAAA